MDRPLLNDDFRELLAALGQEGADYLIVGAHAMAAHGVPRATGDLDVLVRPSLENAERVLRALLVFGASVKAHGLDVGDFAREDVVYQMGLPPRRIDLLTSITGVSFDDAWASKISVEVDGTTFQVLGRDALIANKRATGRPKDQADVLLLTGGQT